MGGAAAALPALLLGAAAAALPRWLISWLARECMWSGAIGLSSEGGLASARLQPRARRKAVAVAAASVSG
jgi:hypothetical protein